MRCVIPTYTLWTGWIPRGEFEETSWVGGRGGILICLSFSGLACFRSSPPPPKSEEIAGRVPPHDSDDELFYFAFNLKNSEEENVSCSDA